LATALFQLQYSGLAVRLAFSSSSGVMKGIIFTEFQELIEEVYGEAFYDEMLSACELQSSGAYTSVGTYDHEELLQLVGWLSAKTNQPPSELVRFFGQRLFKRLLDTHPEFGAGVTSAIDFLASVETKIHVEVRKLYPEAGLPNFAFEQVAPDRWEMTYSSSRPFADLAEGLMLATIDHFGDSLKLKREDLSTPPGTNARFTLVRLQTDGEAAVSADPPTNVS
jgi:hypothetical protein